MGNNNIPVHTTGPKSHKKKYLEEKIKNAFLITLLIIVLFFIPFLFNWCFRGVESSHFFCVNSSMSVSDWFSFWIDYIAVLVSSFLAFAALKLSNIVEMSNKFAEMDKNVELLQIVNFSLDLDLGQYEKTDYKILVEMPLGILGLNSLKIESAHIEFKDGKKFYLSFNDENINGNCFTLYPQINNETNANTIKLLKWKYRDSTLTSEYETINVNIIYSYKLHSFLKRKKAFVCETETICKLKMDQKNFDKTQIVDMVAIANRIN
jgi:hypothetical protein